MDDSGQALIEAAMGGMAGRHGRDGRHGQDVGQAGSGFEVGLLGGLPLLGGPGVVVEFGVLGRLGLEGSDDLEGLLEVGHLADGVLEAADLDQLLHPGRLGLQQPQQRLLGHRCRQPSEHQRHFLPQLLLQLVLGDAKYLAGLSDEFALGGRGEVEVGEGGGGVVAEAEEDGGFAAVVEFAYSADADPGVLLEAGAQVVCELGHLAAQVDAPLHVEQQQLHHALPLGVHPPALHLPRLHLVGPQERRVHQRVRHPLERRLQALLLSDGLLALADWREQELDAGGVERSGECLAAEVDVCECEMEGRFHEVEAAELRDDFGDGTHRVGRLLRQHVLGADAVRREEPHALLQQRQRIPQHALHQSINAPPPHRPLLQAGLAEQSPS